MSASGTSCLSLMVSAWLWQRIAPTRTQTPSIGIGGVPKPAPRPRILLVSALPFHSSLARAVAAVGLSIHGIRLPASGTPKLLGLGDAHARAACAAPGGRSRGSRDAGSSSSAAHLGVQRAILRQQLAHVLRAAARGGLVGHAAHPLDEAGLEQRAMPISMQLTVQLPPM